MIEANTYEQMKQFSKTGGSWTIWEMPQDGENPRARVGDMSVFKHPDILAKLNRNYVFVGINQAGHDTSMDELWWNFHSKDNRRQQDYKLRYALHGTKYWGAYMTDAIKNVVERVAANVRLTAEEEIKNADLLKHELDALGGHPVLIGMGGKAYRFLNRYFGKKYHVVKIYHYSYHYRGCGNKDIYRKAVLNALSDV
jgi:hypothetical protein